MRIHPRQYEEEWGVLGSHVHWRECILRICERDMSRIVRGVSGLDFAEVHALLRVIGSAVVTEEVDASTEE